MAPPVAIDARPLARSQWRDRAGLSPDFPMWRRLGLRCRGAERESSWPRTQGEAFAGGKGEPEDEGQRRFAAGNLVPQFRPAPLTTDHMSRPILHPAPRQKEGRPPGRPSRNFRPRRLYFFFFFVHF